MNRREFLIYKFNKLIISKLAFKYRSTRWDRAYALDRYLHHSSNKFQFDFDSQKKVERKRISFWIFFVFGASSSLNYRSFSIIKKTVTEGQLCLLVNGLGPPQNIRLEWLNILIISSSVIYAVWAPRKRESKRALIRFGKSGSISILFNKISF